MTILARDAHGATVPVIYPGTRTQKLAVGAASAQSTAFAPATTVIRVRASVDCHIAVGDDPTATDESTPLSSGVPEYFAVKPGQKLAVIQASAGGFLWITEGENF